jgi:hypothetical protein
MFLHESSYGPRERSLLLLQRRHYNFPAVDLIGHFRTPGQSFLCTVECCHELGLLDPGVCKCGIEVGSELADSCTPIGRPARPMFTCC